MTNATAAELDGIGSIGIALSSGGAAGLAHIGVIEELADAGFAIDHVAGTSAGALVGAAFASRRLEQLRALFVGVTRRQRVTWFDPCWAGGGLFAGRRLMSRLRPFLNEEIEDLPRRFAALATDLGTGAAVVLRSGSVLDAVRASIAIPGIFTPVTFNGRLLVDGALVDPIPVQAARELGAQFVIGVSVIPSTYAAPVTPACRSTADGMGFLGRYWRTLQFWRTVEAPNVVETQECDIAPSNTCTGLSMVLARASVVIQAQIAAARLREHPPDFLIEPAVETIGVFDFHRTNEAIEAGREAARQALPALRDAVVGHRGGRRKSFRSLAFSRQAA